MQGNKAVLEIFGVVCEKVINEEGLCTASNTDWSFSSCVSSLTFVKLFDYQHPSD